VILNPFVLSRRGVERRREKRIRTPAVRARVRPGHLLVVVNVTSDGALVQAGRPLRPGSPIEVQFETDARRGRVAARILRCAVAAIDSATGVTYRAALSFDERCEWLCEPPTRGGYRVHAAEHEPEVLWTAEDRND
jgi:hypothetical protein